MKKTVFFPLFALFVFNALTTFAETKIETALCPVCWVQEGETEEEIVKASAEYDGNAYGFCSISCRDTFMEAPIAYVPPVFPRPAPPFTVRDLQGGDFSSEELEGRIVLLDFWATWCPPCVTDLPKLTELHERYVENGLTVLSVSIDEGKAAAKKVSRMIKKRKATHPVYLDSLESPAWSAYNVRVVPTQYLIDGQGNVVAQWSGKIDLAVVEAEIARLIESQSSGP